MMPNEAENEEIESQLQGVKIMVEQSRLRTEMARKRTTMSVERTYTNYERTLSVWVRTALAAMAFGIAVDRVGAVFHVPTPSTIAGSILILYSMLVAFVAAIRFMNLSRGYKKDGYDFITKHKVWLPPIYAFMVVLFGAGLLVMMIWII